MPPDTLSQTNNPSASVATISVEWRKALGLLAASSIALIALAAREWGEMLHQWWNIDTYSHIVLVPLIIGWLVAIKFGELAKISPRPWVPGIAIVAAALGLWLIGRASGINLIAHAGAVGMLQGMVIAAIGPRASIVVALPIAFGVFLVPFGDEIIPPLQAITAEIAIALTLWSGVPAEIDGIYIDTPAGLFIVAEACSGVKFLVAMVTLAVLVCFTRFKRWSHRALFILASIIVPIIANGVRAWGTIYIAQSQGVEFAAGFDHIFYGWIFFAIVVALILSAAWRYFDREPEDYGWTADAIARFSFIHSLERGQSSAIVVFAALAAMVILTAIAASIVDPGALG